MAPRQASNAAGYPKIFKARKTTTNPRRRRSKQPQRHKDTKTRKKRGLKPATTCSDDVVAGFSPRLLCCVVGINAYVAFGQIARPDPGRSRAGGQHHTNLNFFFR